MIEQITINKNIGRILGNKSVWMAVKLNGHIGFLIGRLDDGKREKGRN